jgi:hypothetical protein
VQPVPVKVQVPEIVFPFAVPVSVSVFPLGDPECTVNPNCPLTLPLKFPLNVKVPVATSPETKHGEWVVNWNVLTVIAPAPVAISEVPNANSWTPFISVRVAFQLPVIFPAPVELVPHPASTTHTITSIAAASFFIKHRLLEIVVVGFAAWDRAAS